MSMDTCEKKSLEGKSSHFVLRKLEGNADCFNDVIIIKCSQSNAKYNLIYFGGDIQVITFFFSISIYSSLK